MTVSTLGIVEQPCFQFKASFIPCAVLQLLNYDLDAIQDQISATVRCAPNLFKGSFVIIDLEKLNPAEILNFLKLKQIVTTNNMVPIAIRGGSAEQQQAAVMDGLSLLPATKLNFTEFDKQKNVKQTKQTKLVTHPIRSGMQVYAKDGDLIVTSAVSPGAELFSDGNIHVYGALRGRALAGVQGNMQARIFCRSLEAELVSISGYYLTKEDMQTFTAIEGMVQIFLENEKVRIEAI